ncbi:MAG: protein-tyrosine phosphatase family protein, partial [Gaiella sp.]
MELPIRDCYPVAGRLLAGEYPGARSEASARRRIERFEEHGVTHFVDLTHPADLLEPYAPYLRTARRLPHAIVDMGVPTVPHLHRILDDVDAALAEGGSVYVHCWGGIGRTGTVIGCWLVRHG